MCDEYGCVQCGVQSLDFHYRWGIFVVGGLCYEYHVCAVTNICAIVPCSYGGLHVAKPSVLIIGRADPVNVVFRFGP